MRYTFLFIWGRRGSVKAKRHPAVRPESRLPWRQIRACRSFCRHGARMTGGHSPKFVQTGSWLEACPKKKRWCKRKKPPCKNRRVASCVGVSAQIKAWQRGEVCGFGPAIRCNATNVRGRPVNIQRSHPQKGWLLCICWRLPIVPGRFQPSIVGTSGLNCRVRDGNGCTPTVINTNYISGTRP